MRHVLIALVLLVVAAAALAADRSEKIRELMEAQGLVQTFEQQIQAGKEQSRKMADDMLAKVLLNLNPPPEVQTEFRAATHEFLEAVRAPWTPKDIVDTWGKYYGAKFSDEELDQLLKYYRSPLGQKDAMASREALVPYTAEFQVRYKPIFDTALQKFLDRLQVIVKECNCKKRVESTGT